MGSFISLFGCCWPFCQCCKCCKRPGSDPKTPLNNENVNHSENVDDDQERAISRHGLSSKSHVKVLKGLPFEKFDEVVERLSERYKLSQGLKEQILQIKNSEIPEEGEKLEGEKYTVLVVKRETEFDIHLFGGSTTRYT